MKKEQKAFHKSRRQQLVKKIGKDSVAVVFSNSVRNKSFDSSYKFKQNNNFYYLTGFDEPNSILVLAPAGIPVKDSSTGKKSIVKELLFVQKRDPDLEKWDGKRLGSENVKKELGIELGMNNSSFNDIVNSGLAFSFNNVYMNIIDLYDNTGDMKAITDSFVNSLRVMSSWAQISDISIILGAMRKVKAPFEIDLIQRAADITAHSLNQVLKQLKPGMYEYNVQAILESNYIDKGSSDNAFDAIVASGENACTLHYISNREKIKDGTLVLIDTGAEFENYCADITRTFPANGKFTKEQRLIYDIVLLGNKAGIKMCKSGTKYSKIDKEVKKVMAEELVKHKIIKDTDHIKRVCYHGIGHDLGLDTHDAVPFKKVGRLDFDVLKPGNVTTVEPGLYFPPGTEGFDKKYTGIGIRIEDDVLVTSKGNRVLTDGITKEADEIEKIMASN